MANGIFRKGVTYDNIKRHIKPGFHRLFGRYIFRKITNEARGLKGGGGGGLGFLGLSWGR